MTLAYTACMPGRRIISISVKSCLAAAALFLAGCGVQRELVFTSNPTNALIYLNGEEIGRTPVSQEFLWYGKYDVIVRKDGYVTARTTTRVKPPWWQWIPFDLVAELLPIRLRDKQVFSYSLFPASTQPADTELMLENAAEYRAKLEGVGTTQPAANPHKHKKGSATTRPARPKRHKPATTRASGV